MEEKEDLEAMLQRVRDSQNTVEVWRDDFASIERKEASRLHRILYGSPLENTKGCGCVDDFFSMVINSNSILTKIQMMSNKQFQINKGRTIICHNHAHVSESSSDELMISLLKHNPKHIKSFATYPENWEEIVAAYDPKAGTAAPSEITGAMIGDRVDFLLGMGYELDGEATNYLKEECTDVSLERIATTTDENFYKPFTMKLIKEQLELREIEFETDANKAALINLIRAAEGEGED